MSKVYRSVLCLVFIVALLFSLAIGGCSVQADPLVIAVAVGFSGTNNQNSLEALRGV